MRNHLRGKRERIHISLISLVLCIISLVSMTSCSGSIQSGLMPALGAGRSVSDSIDSTVETEPQAPAVPDRGITVCVDPGHGFDDPGAPSDFLGGLAEKDVTLPIAERLIYHLEQYGFNVVVTHDGETFPVSTRDNGNNKFDPIERSAYVNANADKINFLVSVHCNAFDSPDVSGTKVYYFVPKNADGTIPESEEGLAAETIRSSIENTFPDAVKPTCDIGNFQMVRDTLMSSVLVEVGFLTNEQDSAKMLDEKWRDEIAKAIADGIDSFYTETQN